MGRSRAKLAAMMASHLVPTAGLLLVLACGGCGGDPTPTPNSGADARIPRGSGDYSGALADAEAYKKGDISFGTLQKRVLARQLPPHPLGCAYLMIPVPQPPPGMSFNAWDMPRDWEHNFGEIAMTHWVGALGLEDYNKLHEAAHPGEKSR